MSNDLIDLGFKPTLPQENTSGTQIAGNRAEHETQASYVIAQKFPRNEMECYARIIETCKRPFLAEQAMYAYPKGGTLVTGPSIRLAEAIAQSWKHLKFGWEEISQSNGVSTVKAYCVDRQNNNEREITFHVEHKRHTKKGDYKITDPREIYELCANQAARRLRQCILAIIPGDIIEAAINQCKLTTESSEIPLADRIKAMVVKFAELGVSVELLEKRLGHNLSATIASELTTLIGVYKSIKDGFAAREDFFDFGVKEVNSAKETLDTVLSEKKARQHKTEHDPKTGELKESHDKK